MQSVPSLQVKVGGQKGTLGEAQVRVEKEGRENPVMCPRRKPGNDSKMLVCETCDKGYHTFCLKPPMEELPAHSWKCKVSVPQCSLLSLIPLPAAPQVSPLGHALCSSPVSASLLSDRWPFCLFPSARHAGCAGPVGQAQLS